MSLTLLALFFLPVLLKMVIDPVGMYKTLTEWGNSRALQFLSALLPLLLSLLILSTSDVSFKWNWESALSWFAVLIALKAISHLFPSVVAWKMRMITPERVPVFGFFGLLVALGMVYLDTQIL